MPRLSRRGETSSPATIKDAAWTTPSTDSSTWRRARRRRRCSGSHVVRPWRVAVGGDVTFGIDEEAERSSPSANASGWAVHPQQAAAFQGADHPQAHLVVQHLIQRQVLAGRWLPARSRCRCPWRGEPTMGDVVAAAVQEIKSGDLFVAEKGAGFSMRRSAGGELPCATARVDIESLFWTLGFRAGPAVVLAGVLAELIDTSSVGGSVYRPLTVTRILTGQSTRTSTSARRSSPRTTSKPSSDASVAATRRNLPDLAAVHLLCRRPGTWMATPTARRLRAGPSSAPTRATRWPASPRATTSSSAG